DPRRAPRHHLEALLGGRRPRHELRLHRRRAQREAARVLRAVRVAREARHARAPRHRPVPRHGALMGRPRVGAGGGFPALAYVLRKGREAGGIFSLYRRLASRNACKTCALGMGGQRGGMTNEAGHFPEVCKKSAQAQAADMHAVVDEAFLARTPLAAMEAMSSRQLEAAGRLAFPLLAERGATHFRRIGWDELFARAGAAF